nr:DUF11 domain-containing protein [Halocynthiibacter namhaensis]
MVKTLASGGPTYDAVDQELTFNFAVKNEGNITLTDPIIITDALITDAGETITCDPTPLAPGATLNCEGVYAVTQADIDAGSISNSATAKSDQAAETSPSVVDVLAVQDPALAMTKVADNMAAIDFFVGAVARYTYTVTNAGNVTITDPVMITDNKIDSADITCPVFPLAGLAPTETYVCTAEYIVTVADNSLAVVTNNATVSDGNVTSPSVSETVPNSGTPALETVKALFAVNGDDSITTFDAVGDVLTYEFTVTNAGTVSFSNDIVVIDPMLPASPITCFATTAANPDVTAGETVTCRGDYTVTQADLDAGEVFNEATGRTTFGAGPTTVESPVGSATTLADTDPKLELVKTVATLPVTAVDQVLTYTLTTTNTGNQTLSNVKATDPLLPTLVCEVASLAPGAKLECSDDYIVTQDNIDSATLVNTADVTSTNPQGGAVEHQTELTTNMPTPAPSFTLVKDADVDPFGAVGTAVLYTFTATNTGTVTLFDVTITDDIVDPPYSCIIARLDVGTNDDSCTLSYEVTQNDIDAGEIVNVASGSAKDPFDTVVETTGGKTIDGPVHAPAFVAVKTASFDGTTVGSEITYTLTIENNGNVSLTPPVIVDTTTRKTGAVVSLDAPFAYQSGDDDDDDEVDVSETWTYTAIYTLGQADINAGGLSNTVVATAQSPDGTPASDTSDDEIVTYEIKATNIGNVTLTVPTITDVISRLDDTAAVGDMTGPTLTSGNAAGIDPGESWVWSFTYKITQDDVDAGGLQNTATAGGTAPNGDLVSDKSDNGDDSDGNTTDDATRLEIPPMPELTTIKELVSIGTAAGEEVKYLITVTNSGNTTMSNITVVDTMTNNDGTVLSAVDVAVATGNPSTLPVGEAITYDVTYVLTQDDMDSGGLSNTATASGLAPPGASPSGPGAPITDVSDISSGGNGSTPTPAAITQIDSLVATKIANTPTRVAPKQFEVTFTMTLENAGNVTQKELVLEDDLAAFIAPATLVEVSAPVATGFSTGSANSAYDGTSDILLTSADTVLAPGDMGTVELTIVYDVTAGQPANQNVFAAKSARIAAPTTALAPVIAIGDPDILAIKTVTPDRATVGQTVTYTMTFTNNLVSREANLTFVDALPVGLIYTPDTATYNGADTPQPDVEGRTLLWRDVSLDPTETVTLTVQARVVDGGLGDIINEAYVLDSSGARVSNIATATLRLPVEAVFDCADIIGKVFDDKNMNGYQDGVFGPDGVAQSTSEPGLANVRLSTVTGTLITTDEFGRFNVPCAELPGDIGTNFTLKLDTRSLPSGYQLTTENPRVIRVTAGTMARMNFGATIATLVDIDLTGAAFTQGSPEITPALIAGVDQLISALQEDPSVTRGVKPEQVDCPLSAACTGCSRE